MTNNWVNVNQWKHRKITESVKYNKESKHFGVSGLFLSMWGSLKEVTFQTSAENENKSALECNEAEFWTLDRPFLVQDRNKLVCQRSIERLMWTEKRKKKERKKQDWDYWKKRYKAIVRF